MTMRLIWARSLSPMLAQAHAAQHHCLGDAEDQDLTHDGEETERVSASSGRPSAAASRRVAVPDAPPMKW